MSDTRNKKVLEVLENLSKLVGYDLTSLDINEEYDLNIFLKNPESFLEDEELISKVRDINEMMDLSTSIMSAEEGR